MKPILLFSPILIFFPLFLYSSTQETSSQTEENIRWVNANVLLTEGQGWHIDDLESPYDRLPLKAKDIVRKEVWDLSKDSAGICIRFVTDSSLIKVKWTLRKNFYMKHMSPTGIKGVDLYCKTTDKWQWVGVGMPSGKTNEAVIESGMKPKLREFMLYLPLYDGIESLYIGIDSNRDIGIPEKRKKKPILFYGTSITQGGCAARPGTAYPAIIGRDLDYETINLGFSGNGRMDLEIAELISELDVECYVIDTLPNMTPEQIDERVELFIKKIKLKKPDVPILVLESFMYETAFFDESKEKIINLKNEKLKKAYKNLIDIGIKKLYYLEGKDLIGNDHEATVDGVHLTDLGFFRIASAIENVLVKDIGLHK